YQRFGRGMENSTVTRELPEGDEAAEAAGSCRTMRADARRNYEKLLAAAREEFAAEGGGASMEAVARKAGVGVGTLYRHFPKRIDLVQAVYEDDVDELVETAQHVVAELEPWPAVAAFLDAFVRYARSKRTFLNELREAFDKDPAMRSRLRERIDDATELVIGRAQRAGAIRPDVDGADLTQLLGPMCTNPTLTDDQSVRLLPMILDGLRAGRDVG
ncbi:MAG TPA: TetR/AcrR family transcriptional regulator, partial [Acidimicrobiales bacterium]|nr:TetR/AcrR family transcriptional regulator [Acidimicrobiales bacterium]